MTRGTPEGWCGVLVRMPVELRAALKAKAVRDDRTMAQAIRYALRLYVGEAAVVGDALPWRADGYPTGDAT